MNRDVIRFDGWAVVTVNLPGNHDPNLSIHVLTFLVSCLPIVRPSLGFNVLEELIPVTGAFYANSNLSAFWSYGCFEWESTNPREIGASPIAKWASRTVESKWIRSYSQSIKWRSEKETERYVETCRDTSCPGKAEKHKTQTTNKIKKTTSGHRNSHTLLTPQAQRMRKTHDILVEKEGHSQIRVPVERNESHIRVPVGEEPILDQIPPATDDEHGGLSLLLLLSSVSQRPRFLSFWSGSAPV